MRSKEEILKEIEETKAAIETAREGRAPFLAVYAQLRKKYTWPKKRKVFLGDVKLKSEIRKLKRHLIILDTEYSRALFGSKSLQ